MSGSAALSPYDLEQVAEAADGMPLEPDHVYLIPPGAYLALADGALRLSKPRECHGARLRRSANLRVFP